MPVALYMRNDLFLGFYRSLLYNPETGVWVSYDHGQPSRKSDFWMRYSSSARLPDPVEDHAELLSVQLSERAEMKKFENAVDQDVFEDWCIRLHSAYEDSEALGKKKKLTDFEKRSQRAQLVWRMRKSKAQLERLVKQAIVERQEGRIMRTKRRPRYSLRLT